MAFLLKIFDYILALFMGLATVWLISFVITEDWNMLIAMFAGMFIGMLVLLPVLMFTSSITTAFHTLPAGMLITMACGMLGGMALAMGHIPGRALYSLAMLAAANIQLILDTYNQRLKGEVNIAGR